MQLVQRYLLAGIVLAHGVGCAAVAVAGVIISPVVLEIDSPRKAIAVKVTNSGDQPITFQTEAVTWKQVNGVDQNTPTDDLLVIPPIVEVPPNATQIFRVMLRSKAPSAVERTYRVVLEDITDKETETPSSAKASVAFRLTHSLPVVIAPAGKITNIIRWKSCPVAAGEAPAAVTSPGLPAATAPQACIRLLNAGNRRVKVQALTLSGDNWQQVLALKVGVNVLAADQREWRVPLQPGQTGAVRGVQVNTARGETLQAEASEF